MVAPDLASSCGQQRRPLVTPYLTAYDAGGSGLRRTNFLRGCLTFNTKRHSSNTPERTRDELEIRKDRRHPSAAIETLAVHRARTAAAGR